MLLGQRENANIETHSKTRDSETNYEIKIYIKSEMNLEITKRKDFLLKVKNWISVLLN